MAGLTWSQSLGLAKTLGLAKSRAGGGGHEQGRPRRRGIPVISSFLIDIVDRIGTLGA